jgi:predicted MPP superfamily phosphohydrolase
MRQRARAATAPWAMVRTLHKGAILHMVVQDIANSLEQRFGRAVAQQRITIEADQVARNVRNGIRVFGIHVSEIAIRTVLKLAGLYRRGCRNAEVIRVKHNLVKASIPQEFEGFSILQLSDLHVDLNPNLVDRLANVLPDLNYDLCVITGDYRGKSSGPFEGALDGMTKVRILLTKPIYGVLGDHDTIRMVPELENMGIRMLLNERVTITHGDSFIHLAGIDDAHRFHADNIDKVASEIPSDQFSILLSHTPEVYRQAADARFKLLLSGHTHGGQVCLPGGFPLTLDATLPRHMGCGPWKYERMIGYTSPGTGSSVVPVRFNCPPEITLHHLHSSLRTADPESLA